MLFVYVATSVFKLMDKYRPESPKDKKARLLARAEARAAGKPDEPTSSKKKLHFGMNRVTNLIESKRAQLVLIASDVDPIEVGFYFTLEIFFIWGIIYAFMLTFPPPPKKKCARRPAWYTRIL